MDARNDSENFDTYDSGEVRRSRSKNKNKRHTSVRKDERDDRLVLNGVVEEALPGTWFNIKINDRVVTVLATLSGKMRQNHIQILPGDKVTVEVSPYDTSRGRITRRN
jgi:translation initiation factor IF-1